MMKCMYLFAVLVALLVCNATAHPWETVEEMPELVPQNETIETTFNTCNLRISTDVGRPSPVMVYPGTVSSIRGSNAAGLLSFGVGQSVQLACPGDGNLITVAGTQEVQATCVSGTTFTVNGRQHSFHDLVCTRWPVHLNRAAGSCLWGKTLVKTGFQISTGFVDLYDACHDEQLHHTYWVKAVLGKDAAGFQSGVPRPDFVPGTFFKGIGITNQYRRATQRVTFTSLLGSQALANRYIHLTNDYFLSKGHLVAKADFLHASHQMATFWYTNAAPQWQTFNGNNWNSLENDVRSFAGRIQKDLDCYTGTFGRADLPDVNGRNVDLYLTTSKRVPVPRMFWKVLHDPTTQAGIAFIGLNNPYQTAASVQQDIRCRDICASIGWLTWQQRDIVRGYSYCCEVNDFRANFPDVPSFPVTSILR